MEQNVKVSLIILSLSGGAILLYALLKRLRKEEKEPPYDPLKDDPILHIKKKLFLEIPVEKIFFGFFGIVTVTYIAKLIVGESLPGVDLTILYLAGIVALLTFYKIGMIAGSNIKVDPWLFFSFIFSTLIFIVVLNGFPVPISQYLEETRQYNLTVHLLGVVLGLGGTLIVDIMFTHFLRNYKISASESVIMHLISQMIILGLILLLTSGAALFFPFSADYLGSHRFLMKMLVVFLVILNGIALNMYVTPRMKKISLTEPQQGRHEMLKRISFALGGISIVSWLSAFLLAMLKDLLDLSFVYLLGGYVVFLAVAIGGSQFAKKYYEMKESKETARTEEK
jgi:hypothetical protein